MMGVFFARAMWVCPVVLSPLCTSRAAAPYAGDEGQAGHSRVPQPTENRASTIAASSSRCGSVCGSPAFEVERLAGWAALRERRAQAIGGCAEGRADHIIQSQRCDRDCASVSAAALQLSLAPAVGQRRWRREATTDRLQRSVTPPQRYARDASKDDRRRHGRRGAPREGGRNKSQG